MFNLKYPLAHAWIATALLFTTAGVELRAQTNSFPATGNVGIGTSPIAKFDVVAGSGTTILRGSGPNAYILIGNLGSGESYYQANASHRFQGAAGLEALTILGSGKVGIGTTNPMAALDVQGHIQISAINASSPPPDINYGLFPYGGVGLGIYSGAADPSQGIGIWTNPAGIKTEVMRILSGGNIGIGTVKPNEKLSVNGKIRAHEIKVEISNWPDYVLKSDYQLPTLESAEQHIKDHGHLQGIPSKAVAESLGIELGEMNKQLLQKVEELTLYLISQHKEINRQSTELAQQSARIKKLEAVGSWARKRR